MSLFRKILHARKLLHHVRNEYWGLLNVQTVGDVEEFLAKYNANSLALIDANTLDLGCGTKPSNPFLAKTAFGIDIRSSEENNVKSADLTTEQIPFSDNSFDYITAHDFLEHIPRVIHAPGLKFAFVELMNEIWRTLKPNGIFYSRTPIYPYAASFRDPTHVNMMTYETLPMYFCKEERVAAMYGFRGYFEVLEQGVRAPYLLSVLRKTT